MSLSSKEYYFLTDRSTLFHYLIDNRQSPPQPHIFYPTIYETMKPKQIKKYENKLVRRFLWWSLFNRDKMEGLDWKICFSKGVDIVAGVLISLMMARQARRFLFRVDYVTV